MKERDLAETLHAGIKLIDSIVKQLVEMHGEDLVRDENGDLTDFAIKEASHHFTANQESVSALQEYLLELREEDKKRMNGTL